MASTETTSYAAYHLKIAGRAGQLFTRDALALIHTTSRGYPRAVNNLSLVAAFATGRNLVDEAAARASVSEVVGDGELISSGRESAAGLADRPLGFAGFAPGRAWSRARASSGGADASRKGYQP